MPKSTAAQSVCSFSGSPKCAGNIKAQGNAALLFSITLNFSKDFTPYIALDIPPNASLYIAINIT